MKKLKVKLTHKQKVVLSIIGSILILIFPFVITNVYFQHIAIITGLYIVLSLSLNLVSGYSGQLSMGHAAFYGVGAYVTALLMADAGFSFWLSILISVIVSGLFGLLLGLPTTRLRGDYLTIVTLGFGEILRMVLTNEEKITHGPMGIAGIPSPTIFGISLSSTTCFYYMILALVVIVTIFISRLVNSGFGLAMQTIKENEIAAKSIGIKPIKYKLIAFILSAMIAGLAGSFYATYTTFISPNTFLFNDSATILATVVLGGIASIPGSIIGASVLTVLPELLRSFSDYRMILYGLAMVIMMNVRPTGFYGQEKRLKNSYKLKLGGNINEKHIRSK